MFSDSWGYLGMAFGKWPVAVAPLRPSGYPLTLRVLSVFGRDLGVITAVQHLAGLVTAGLVYAIARYLGARRGLAAVAAAVVALDAYAIVLEQYVLAEAFFTLAITAAAFLSVTGRPSARRLGAAGVLIAAAVLMRPVGLFAVPAWLAWIAWTRPGLRPGAAALAAVLVPILVYSAAHASVTGTFGLTQSDGWFLYGRVASLVRCSPASVPASERRLCTRVPGNPEATFYIFSPMSPAHLVFGRFSADAHRVGRGNDALRRFSLGVITDHPVAYARLVAVDVARFFIPGSGPPTTDDRTLSLPATAKPRWDDPAARRRYAPTYTQSVNPPAAALRAYGRIVHTPRWLLALCVVGSLAAVVAGPRERRRALVLLLAVPLAILVGAAATAGFTLRYVVPAVPLLVAAGAVAAGARTGPRRPSAAPPGSLEHAVGTA